ncbi:MAG: DUF255 domain-containing protein [Sulfurimonas sp.]|nr:DUF255 domain-containing protein [Sulfurimonas sp.]MDQ7061698.1 DUF255 domain-containing protein [Sulfurimonas sp.]
MKILLCLFLSFSFVFGFEYTNELSRATSPYLKQHQHNPINWLAWSEKAFNKAKKEHKAIFISIGYSTCHWCHVMAKESFENEKIAAMFNEYFICIKVDKEEMPHLDKYYQEMYKNVKGRIGGWPLSVFLTEDKEPFYFGSYIPPTTRSYHEGIDTLLPSLYNLYTHNKTKLSSKVKEIEALTKQKKINLQNKDANISIDTLSESILESYDDIYSGFGRRKKFPESSKLSLMMDISILSKNESIGAASLEMLDTMALRGLYDHIDGGFFRYTVDAAWEIPHFEKMLYNQAELIPLYVQAYHKTKKELYKNIVIETIAMLDKKFMINDLYYSASDADVNHIEGDYFIFSKDEIKQALLKNRYKKEIEESLDISLNGNFSQKIHLNFYGENRPLGFKAFKKVLSKIREKKEFPFVDKKINTAWNALMIKALYSASTLDEKYKIKADKHLASLKKFAFINSELYHQSLIKVKPTQLALLEDYSFLISALLEGYNVDLDTNKLAFIEYLLAQSKEKFYKNNRWYLSDDSLYIQAGMNDKYYSSPLSITLQNLLKFASIKSSYKYYKLAQDTLASMNHEVQMKQINTPASSQAFLMNKLGVVTLKSSKQNLLKFATEIKNISYPYIVLKAQESDDFLACTMKNCFAIDKDFFKVKKVIESKLWR